MQFQVEILKRSAYLRYTEAERDVRTHFILWIVKKQYSTSTMHLRWCARVYKSHEAHCSYAMLREDSYAACLLFRPRGRVAIQIDCGGSREANFLEPPPHLLTIPMPPKFLLGAGNESTRLVKRCHWVPTLGPAWTFRWLVLKFRVCVSWIQI